VEAFWRRPEALLDPRIRAAQSVWSLIDERLQERIFTRLAADLSSGLWDTHHGHLRGRREFNGSLRLVISEPA
jgi:hypothetical protein